MSNKEKVLKKFHEAVALSWGGSWFIFSKRSKGEYLGEGDSENSAWQDACDLLEKNSAEFLTVDNARYRNMKNFGNVKSD